MKNRTTACAALLAAMLMTTGSVMAKTPPTKASISITATSTPSTWTAPGHALEVSPGDAVHFTVTAVTHGGGMFNGYISNGYINTDGATNKLEVTSAGPGAKLTVGVASALVGVDRVILHLKNGGAVRLVIDMANVRATKNGKPFTFKRPTSQFFSQGVAVEKGSDTYVVEFTGTVS